MSDAERVRRIARAQRALADAAAARHTVAVRERRESEEEAVAIVSVLSSDSLFHGVAVTTMATALRENGLRTAALAEEVAAAERARRRAETAADLLDERAKVATRRERAADDRRLAEELGATWHLLRRR